MGLLHRRLPLYGRPLPFLLSAVAFVAGLYQGLNWTWDWSLQTGNVFVLILIPQDLITVEGGRAFWLLGALVAFVVLFAAGTKSPEQTRRQLDLGAPWRSRATFRFYPLTFLFGVFVLYFGLVFLFDASVYGDKVPGGVAAFVYLDYAGLLDRPFVTFVGLALSGLGLACAGLLAFENGLGVQYRIRRTVPPRTAPLMPPRQPLPAPMPTVPARPPPSLLAFTPRTARSTLVVPEGARSAVASAKPAARTVGIPPRPHRLNSKPWAK